MGHVGVFVLDITTGKPAARMTVSLWRATKEGGAEYVTRGVTDTDGCIEDLLPDDEILDPGTYRLIYDTEGYFTRCGVEALYPEIQTTFRVIDHVRYVLPLLISAHSYTTYRGS